MTTIDLGTCVLVAMAPDRPRSCMALEGVVREVVAAGGVPRTHRVQPNGPRRAPIVRYVVQCYECRLLRAKNQMVVVCQ